MASSRTTTPDRPAAADAPGAEAAPQLLTFVVAGRRYGCRLEAVREIFVARSTTRLPGAPPHVLGLLNLRGSLLTVVDLGRWLGEQDDFGSQLSARAIEPQRTRRTRRKSNPRDLGAWGSSVSSVSSVVRSLSDEYQTENQEPSAEQHGPSGHVLVIEAEGRFGGCRVDGLGRAMAMPALDPAPGGNEGGGGIVLGVGEADGELVAVLDLPRLVRLTLLFPGER